MFLIVVDAYSKWTEVCVMRTSTDTAMIEKMRGIFATHGLPVLVVSDNGPCFSSQEFKMLMKNKGIRHIFTAPYHPSSNGQAERSVFTFKEALKKMEADRKATLETKVSRFLFTYRTTSNTATGIPPAGLMYKRWWRTTFHLLKPDIYQVLGYKNRMEQGTKVGAPLWEFKVNDSVLLCNFGSGQWWMEGTITKTVGGSEFWSGDRWKIAEETYKSTVETSTQTRSGRDTWGPDGQHHE